MESIETLLKTTGLSCDELLLQLQRYKSAQDKRSSSPQSTGTVKNQSNENDSNENREISVINHENLALVADKSDNTSDAPRCDKNDNLTTASPIVDSLKNVRDVEGIIESHCESNSKPQNSEEIICTNEKISDVEKSDNNVEPNDLNKECGNEIESQTSIAEESLGKLSVDDLKAKEESRSDSNIVGSIEKKTEKEELKSSNSARNSCINVLSNIRLDQEEAGSSKIVDPILTEIDTILGSLNEKSPKDWSGDRKINNVFSKDEISAKDHLPNEKQNDVSCAEEKSSKTADTVTNSANKADCASTDLKKDDRSPAEASSISLQNLHDAHNLASLEEKSAKECSLDQKKNDIYFVEEKLLKNIDIVTNSVNNVGGSLNDKKKNDGSTEECSQCLENLNYEHGVEEKSNVTNIVLDSVKNNDCLLNDKKEDGFSAEGSIESSENLLHGNNISSTEEKSAKNCLGDGKKNDNVEVIASRTTDIVSNSAGIDHYSSNKKEEDLHDILRMQLFSLRTMKKTGSYLSDIQKNASVSFHNMKKKRKSTDIKIPQAKPDTQEVTEKATLDTEEVTEKEDSYQNEDSIISLTDEANFIISDVSGGVDRLSPLINEESVDKHVRQAETKNQQENFLKNFLENHRKKLFEYSADSPHIKKIRVIENVINNVVDKSIGKDAGVTTNIKNNEKSPFVSDSLDNFLNESAKLKISYAIPKLGAEEGINESQKVSPYEALNNTSSRKKYETLVNHKKENTDIPKERPKLVKAKTVAEMRRRLQKIQQQELREKKSKQENFDGYSSEPTVAPHRNSFVLYNRKRIWVPCTSRNTCVGSITKMQRRTRENLFKNRIKALSRVSVKQDTISTRRPSLLSSISNNDSPVKYKPGPLSHKVNLQHPSAKWHSELKPLPQVFLEVTPKAGSAIDPSVSHLLPIFDDPILYQDRVDFALTALKVQSSNETDEAKTFKYQIPFKNNQVKFIIRRENTFETSTESDYNNSSDPQSIVTHILDDLINYVEVKCIADTLIKEDDIVRDEDLIDEKLSMKTAKKHLPVSKKKKINLELQRLNCKIIDVASTTAEVMDCSKPYCKLGCVCQSLATGRIVSNHCEYVDCMFGCKCGPPEIEASSDSLSPITLNNLDDKMKKNLAKVEREFTQTVIHTDNDTIFLGPGGRHKTRRACRVPKKYTDYVESIESFIPENSEETSATPLKECSVALIKYNFTSIVPFCLSHKVYNCSCKGENIENLIPEKPIDRTLPVPKIKPCRIKEPKVPVIKYDSENDSARTRIVFQQYRSRNKDPRYTKKLQALAKSPDRAKNFRNKPIMWNLPSPPETSTLDFDDSLDESYSIENLPHIYQDKTIQEENSTFSLKSAPHITIEHKDPNQTLKKASKRKQHFEVRKDSEQEEGDLDVVTPDDSTTHQLAIQRRKRRKLTNSSLDGVININPITSPYVKIFPGEIHVPIKDNPDMLKIIGKENAMLEYIRILPWANVIKGFRERKINIWAREGKGTALLCNTANVEPPKNCQDIRLLRNKSDIINWILSGKLPSHRPAHLMHLVLTPKRGHFLISGYCLKHIKDGAITKDPEEVVNASTSVASELIEVTDSPTKRKVKPSLPIIPHNNSLRCTHRNMRNECKTLILTSRQFEERTLYFRTTVDGKSTIAVRLPKVAKRFKWWMIHLKSDFSYLTFNKTLYSIKYSDLIDVIKMCCNIKSTIALRNTEFCDNFKHPYFGIFCVPEYQDCLFVGPYLPHESHNVGTLRYMQGNLVDTQIFHQILGVSSDYKPPMWLYESEVSQQKLLLNGVCIDITEDDEEEAAAFDITKESVFSPPFVELLGPDDLVSRKVNRYIITNIPNIGYFPAYQWENKEIDIFWPTADKGFKFPNVTLAKHSLIQYLYEIFTPISEDFKISVVILTHLDLSSNRPINPKYLLPKNGPFICGQFGVYNKDNVPSEILKLKGATSMEHLIKLCFNEEEYVKRMVRIFALYLMNNEELRNCTEPHEVVQWAASETYILRKLAIQYEQQIKDLKYLIDMNKTKVDEMLLKDNEFAEIIALNKSKGETTTVTETIEIPDSDDEDLLQKPSAKQQPQQQKASVLGFKKINASGKIQPTDTSNAGERSVLKKNYALSPGQSVLKTNSPVKIALVNKNRPTLTFKPSLVKIMPKKS